MTDRRSADGDPADGRPRLGIIVVNFGSHELLATNLAAIDRDQANASIIVVDSFSDQKERRVVTDMSRREGWELVTPDDNVGFGVGMNLGASRAIELGCSELLLLNPDVSIDAAAITKLVDEGRRHPSSVRSPQLDQPDGRTWFAGGQLDLRTGRTTTRPDHVQTGPSRWLTGACLVLDVDMWRRLGGFDSRYFLYWEDIDLSQRCLAAGGDLRVVHDVVAVHDVGGTQGTTGKSAIYTYYMCRNRLLFASLQRPRADRVRWLLHTPGYTAKRAFPDGRRAALRHPVHVWPALRGTAAGIVAVLRSMRSQA